MKFETTVDDEPAVLPEAERPFSQPSSVRNEVNNNDYDTGSLSEKFNDLYQAKRDNDYVLMLSYLVGTDRCYLSFDFMTRLLVARTWSSAGGLNITPFSNLDRDVLITMRDKLIDLGGKPPELPPEFPKEQNTPPKAGGLKL